MNNHFVFTYNGNKRGEVERIFNNINFEGIDTIVEPFCGSSAVSYYISTKYPQRFKYILNDIDANLYKLYLILQNEEETKIFEQQINEIASAPTFNKDTYLELLKTKTIQAWFIGNKIKSIRYGLWRLNYKYKYIDIVNCPIVKFMRTENIEFFNQDACKIMQDYEYKNNVVMYLDPPYLSMYNGFYDDKRNLNIYEFIHHRNYERTNIYTTLERHWLVDIIFEKYKKLDEYGKQYQPSKNNVRHVFYRLEQ